jgi:putative oxidoreductase
MAAAYAVFFLETVGAVMIILGLFTRFFAAALAVEFAIITFVAHWPVGFAAGRGGWGIPTFLGPHPVRRCASRWGAVLARP